MAELPPEVRALFEGANFARLATLMPDGARKVRSTQLGFEHRPSAA